VPKVWGGGRLPARSKPIAFGESAAAIETKFSAVDIVELVARSDTVGAANPAVGADAALIRWTSSPGKVVASYRAPFLVAPGSSADRRNSSMSSHPRLAPGA